MTWYTAPLKFAATPVSLLTLILYAVVFISVLVNDQTPDIPKNEDGLNLEGAFRDLQTLTARPHPCTSHENDDVRAFLLQRVYDITSKSDYIEVADDTTSAASYSGVYFEGTNILVKVEGTDPGPSTAGDGVLFSAHFDSVSTAYGATDDGMGIITILQLIEYFSVPERRPRKTGVFLLNNGEEDGLNGAHLFYEHPWSNLTSVFVNLEGAGAGGRPLLFRSSSLGPVRAFTAEGVGHPSANVIGADAFARGVVRSRTDFQVYHQGIEGRTKGMEGVDVAFYQKRSVYHTLQDSIPGMGSAEGKKSLWAMMDMARGAGEALLNGDFGAEDGGVYFDLLGNTLFAFPRQHLFIADVVLLVIGPISVLVLLGWVLVLSQRHTNAGQPDQETDTWTKIKKILIAALGWGRFWIALAIGILAQVGLVAGYVALNPFAVHSYPATVVTAALTLSYLALVVPFAVFQIFFPSPPSSQKLAAILELYFLTWVFLVICTFLVNKLQLGGTYLITGWYICSWVATLIALWEGAERAKSGGEEGGKGELNLVGEPRPEDEDVGERRLVRGVRYERLAEDENDPAARAESPTETAPTEITPLMHQHRRSSDGGHEYVAGVDGTWTRVGNGKGANAGYDETGWWIPQMLALVPLPALLEFQILVLLVHSLGNTMVDGSSPLFVYAMISALSVLIMLNITPFAHRMRWDFTLVVMVVFAIMIAFSWTAFPFTREAPLKLFFQQRLELELPTQAAPHGSIITAETFLTGPLGYIDPQIVPLIPSSSGKEITCSTDNELRQGLRTCKWDSRSLLPSPGVSTDADLVPNDLTSQGTRASDWLHGTFTRNSASNATVSIRGVNSRTCRIAFDTPISAFYVHGSSGLTQPGHELYPGHSEVILWSREWDKEFVVDVQFNGTLGTLLEGRVSCSWAEYATATAGSTWAAKSAQIPALEEVIRFLPVWALPTKWTVGLVEVGARFSV